MLALCIFLFLFVIYEVWELVKQNFNQQLNATRSSTVNKLNRQTIVL